MLAECGSTALEEWNEMRLAILTLAATVLPFFWGWAVLWLVGLVWPERPPKSIIPEPRPSTPIPSDFQI